ncbi:LacI family DNA-binding transcriptional regulator [Mediterraneibacter sp. NSJ-55]|uniref:LacI family DNA-binding transcriptional regulator n=1 Tax=Mediterraneibacter hominis TaxID=2763054 RepID=A0A923LIJ0_9FIRM|nr:LacI family DNA-binding transcriptional regulator [Mediterraneibacter hominis]MBC5689306.1 LacI family DNA-binding transcriptional regulator [Mediterraneibacter hominis]
MVTIKDVAARANVSATTVSIIINGKEKERKISPATVAKVKTAIAQLNYQPNIAARKLRTFDNNYPNIAIYLAYDHRSSMFNQFIESIYHEQMKGAYEFSITVCPFKSGHLFEENALTSTTSFSAAIITTISPADAEFLKQNPPPFPVVLMNRSLDGFSSVCADTQDSILELAEMIQKKGYKRISAILMQDGYMANKIRYQSFLNACETRGISFSDDYIAFSDDSMEGGFQAAKKLMKAGSLPPVLYCDTDSIALGATYVFNRAGIRIPEDLEIVCICLSNKLYTQYSTPSITIIDISLEKNMVDCLKLVLDLFFNKITEPVNKVYKASVIYRESFPELL